MTSARQGQVRTHIDAPPEAVWPLLANLERMGEWSPECYHVQWLDGASSPATPGARFKGRNRFGWMRWSMTCQVAKAEPGRELRGGDADDLEPDQRPRRKRPGASRSPMKRCQRRCCAENFEA